MTSLALACVHSSVVTEALSRPPRKRPKQKNSRNNYVAEAPRPARRAGARKGNRNALKHGRYGRDLLVFQEHVRDLLRIVRSSLLLSKVLRDDPDNAAARAGLVRNLQLSRLVCHGFVEQRDSHVEQSTFVESQRNVGEGVGRRCQRGLCAFAADAAGGIDRRRTQVLTGRPVLIARRVVGPANLRSRCHSRRIMRRT